MPSETYQLFLSSNSILLLLVLTKSSMPDEIIQFLTGNRFASFSFDFLHLESLPGIGIPKRWFLKDQEISSLTEIGIESGSTFYNNFALLLMLFFLLPIHLGVIFLPKCRKMPYSETRWKSILGKFYTKAREALYELFHFSIYIRLILEAYQFIMLACVAEIYQMRYREYASFSISCVALLLCIFFLCLSYFMYSSTKKFYDDEQHYHCKELVRGLKDNKEARIYTFFLLLRRFILVAWLIGMCESNKYFLIVFLSGFQLFYLGRILYSRPLQHVCDNLVEITNEIFFTVLALILVYLNTEDKWKGSNTSIYMYILISNNFVIVSIMFGNLMRNIFVKCKAKCSKNSKTAPKAPQPKPPIILARPSTTSKIYTKSDLSAATKLSTNQLAQQSQNNIIIKKIPRKTG